MKPLALGSFLAALAFFGWGFAFYMITGAPDKVIKTAPTDVGPALQELFPENGTYFVPGIANSEASIELMERGPVAMVHMHLEGMQAMDPMLMLAGFLHGWGYALLLGLLLRQICKKSGYGARVGFVTLAGFAGVYCARIGDAIWWHKSWDWQLTETLYTTIGALVIGLVLAKFIKSPVKN